MCIKPRMAWYNKLLNPTGKRGIHFKPSAADSMRSPFGDIQVPCGKCHGCYDTRRNIWVNRLLLEFDLFRSGTFITLTFRNEPPSLDKRPAQLFLKRLRHVERDFGISIPSPLRYFLAGERGSLKGRPHYHAILFGVNMFDAAWQPYLVSNSNGYPVFSSRVLEKLWPYGFVTIGEATPSSIRYVAKYVCKSSPEDDSFSLKSIGLGASFFFDIKRHGRKRIYNYKHSDTASVLINGKVHISNSRCGAFDISIPKCYGRYIERISPSDFIDYTLMREIDTLSYIHTHNHLQDLAAYRDRLRVRLAKDKIKRTLH